MHWLEKMLLINFTLNKPLKSSPEVQDPWKFENQELASWHLCAFLLRQLLPEDTKARASWNEAKHQVVNRQFSHPLSFPSEHGQLNLSELLFQFSSVQFISVAQSCPTLCDPMNRSTPGLPVHHQLPEFTETHVHRVGDAIQPSYPLLFPSPPDPNPSQHQSLFQWVNSLHEMAKALEFQL